MRDGIAVAHKDYQVRGGGEMVAEAMAQDLSADLVVGHDNPDNHGEVPVYEIASNSRVHRLLDKRGALQAIGGLLLWRDRAAEILDKYEVVVTSGNEPLWWTPRDDQAVVAYTHTVPRMQGDLYNDQPGLLRRSLLQAQRHLYRDALAGVDVWLANSELVRQRMAKYWPVLDRDDIRVVYPPVETEQLSPDHATTGDYYLSLSRLNPPKRVDEIIRVANRLNEPLVVAGDGPERKRLQELAGPTVDIVGWVSGPEKRELLAGAKATVVACRNEDFGIVPVESLASGTPVVTVNEGFPPHIVPDGLAGLHYQRGGLGDALRRLDRHGVQWSPQRMAEYADRHFSRRRFAEEIAEAVGDARDVVSLETGLPDATPGVDVEVSASR
jgi:glycosyltransferase involved in cell wall biosynthesis